MFKGCDETEASRQQGTLEVGGQDWRPTSKGKERHEVSPKHTEA